MKKVPEQELFDALMQELDAMEKGRGALRRPKAIKKHAPALTERPRHGNTRTLPCTLGQGRPRVLF